MPATDTPPKNVSDPKNYEYRIGLVVGVILMVAILLTSLIAFAVMQRQAEKLLSKNLQISLQNRVQLIQTEIGTGSERTRMLSMHPVLINLMQLVNAGADEELSRRINAAVQSLLSTRFKAVRLLDKDGRELAQAGSFTQKPALSVPLNLPGGVQLIWDGQLLLHAVVDIQQAGQVVGRVITETVLPVATDALKDVYPVGATGELALCASLGLNMQCFPTTRNSEIFTLPKRSPQGVPWPMTLALEGKTGFIHTVNSRQQPVAAAYAPVGDLGLGLVLHNDSAEFYASVWGQLRYLIPLLIGVFVIAVLSLRWLLTPLVRRLVRSEAQAQEMSASLGDRERHERALLDNVGEGIVSISESGLIQLFNLAAERMFGYRSEEVVGKNVSMLMPEPDHSTHDGHMARYLHTGQAKIIGIGREVKGRRSDGSVFPMELRTTEFFLEGRRQFIGLMHDITQRERITQALHASELQLRQITNAVPALIADLDIAQRFRFHNQAYEEVFGLSFEQINGHTLAEVLGQPAYESVQDKVEKVLRGDVVRYEYIQNMPQGESRNYAMQYFPRYGQGADEGKIIGFFSLGTDITELKRIDRMKTEFVSTVSHELRTPLTSIRGSLGLIDGGVAGELPKAVKNLVGIAKNNCERLIRLINDILDSEKIESGELRLDLQVANIKLLVQLALVSNQGFANQYRVILLLQAPDELLQVRIDSDRMLQVLTNLLSNAVKFSPPESVVKVKVSRVAQGVRVEVADHGPGIPEEFRGRIFQKFSQADSSDSRKKDGTGLGLAISKALIQKMGGQIGFSSEVGAGTTFFFELPEWQDPAPLRQPVRTQAVFSRPSILVCDVDADAARLERDKPRILHVEEDPDIQHIVAAIVHDFASFEHVATLDDARARLREQRFDLVLLDLTLGQDSGWDLFEDIHALDPPPPVIVFSASDADPAKSKQVEAVLVKACTSNAELLNTIQRVLHLPGDPGPTRPQPLS